jgi:tRNA G18 (ribose-2'-O)-methylase SpoU
MINSSSLKIIKKIESPQNKIYKGFQKILDSRGIKKRKEYFLFGAKIIKETIDFYFGKSADWNPVLAWVLSEAHFNDPMLRLDTRIPAYLLSNPAFQKLDIINTSYPLLLMQDRGLATWDGELSTQGLDLFLPLQDPGNLGTAIRSGAAFGVSRIILLTEAAYPFQPKVVRAAGSALYRVPLFGGPSLENLLAMGDRLSLAVLDRGGLDIKKISQHKSLGLIIGIEGPGFNQSPEIFPKGNIISFGIPMCQGMESLNAAGALAIALYEYQTGKS